MITNRRTKNLHSSGFHGVLWLGTKQRTLSCPLLYSMIKPNSGRPNRPNKLHKKLKLIFDSSEKSDKHMILFKKTININKN